MTPVIRVWMSCRSILESTKSKKQVISLGPVVFRHCAVNQKTSTLLRA